MKNKIKYTHEPIETRVISDFLPKPEELILNEKQTRVILPITEKSLKFFKNAAKKHKASHEVLIGRLLDYYVANQRA